MDICLRVLKESNKSRFDSYSVKSSVFCIFHITFGNSRVHIFPTTFLEIAVYRSSSIKGAQNCIVKEYSNRSITSPASSVIIFQKFGKVSKIGA